MTRGGHEERAHAKRMGMVAVVYTIEPYLRTPEQIVRELGPVHEPLPPTAPERRSGSSRLKVVK